VKQKASVCYRSKYAMASWLIYFIGMGALKILNLLKTDQVQVTLQLICQSVFLGVESPPPPPHGSSPGLK